ncbi:MAG: twin-arginine translocase TatA/TatE family subunit [Solirubrobacteraceae bacterium]
MGSIGLPELLIVLFVILLILGPKRLPALGRSVGSGLRELKDSVRSKDDDDDPSGLPSADERERTGLDGEVVREPDRRV